MIAVVADDFTGAAELAAIGHRIGLSTRIHLGARDGSCSDLTVVDTDSRSDPPERAREKVAAACRFLQANGIDKVYKKVDSALRGQILPEVETLAAGLGRERVLLAPANPSLGRLIENETLTIDGCPIDATAFADDPEFPAKTAEVLSLLGRSDGGPIAYRKVGATLPGNGTVITEIRSLEDLDQWAGEVDARTLPAGGAEFFRAVLKQYGVAPSEKPDTFDCAPFLHGRRLFISGSATANRKEVLEKMRARGCAVVSMPGELMAVDQAGPALDQWADAVQEAFSLSRTVCAAIGQPISRNNRIPARLCNHMTGLVKRVLPGQSVEAIFLEGGATASAIARGLDWRVLEVTREWALGVVSLRIIHAIGPGITIKPGSYHWPEALWESGRP